VDTPKEEAKAERTNAVAPPPEHTHPYPVPGHDARPHDPSQPHAHDDDRVDDHDHDADRDRAEGAPAAAAPVVASEAAAKMPVFSMASGSGSMTAGSTRVADGRGDGAGTGGSAGEGAAPNATYPANGVSVPAKLVAVATAAYPADARADDVEGDVGLEIVVDAEGRVVDARVVTQGGHGFDASALAAIRRYRFSAAQRDGRNVRVRMPWTVQFRLR
jgi:TonB family protein